MTRLRVLRVIARMNVGGPALQVVNLQQGLDPARFESRLLAGSVGADEADYLDLRAPTLAVTRVPGLGRAPSVVDDARAFEAIVREMRAFRPHIVHTHTAKAGVLGRLAATITRVPATVHTFHGHLLHGYFSPRVTNAVVHTERALARVTTRLVAVGSQVRDELVAAGIGRVDQYDVVPPGVSLPPTPTTADARRLLGLPPDATVVAYVARLTQVKRPDRFVDVATRVAATHPDVLFAVAGEGALLDEMRRQAAPLGDRMRFLGWRGDVETIYGAADLVVLTSDNEGMPVSLIEAATCGRAAVTTAVGSAAEVVEDGVTGFVVPKDAAALAVAVDRLLAAPDMREEMGRAAATRAAERFGAARLVADTARLYEHVAELKGL